MSIKMEIINWYSIIQTASQAEDKPLVLATGKTSKYINQFKMSTKSWRRKNTQKPYDITDISKQVTDRELFLMVTYWSSMDSFSVPS